MKNPPDIPLGNHLPDSYLTLVGPGEAELKVKRSRFLARAYPVVTEPEAREWLGETARRYHDARHVCYGFQLGLGQGSLTRKSDDGEPSGTAGEPLLGAIRKLGLTDVLVIVVRYFGGVKLGTGGLARAYGQAAAMALVAPGIREVQLGREFVLEFPYHLDKTMRRLLETGGGKLLNLQYGESVTWRLWLPHSQWRQFSENLTELTAGAVTLAKPVD